MLRLRGVLLGCLFAVPSAGCGGAGGGADAGPLVPVEGTVTNNGRPVPNGEVTFIPEDESAKVSPGGQIAPDGKYSLQTGGKPGAPVGKYRVTVALDDPKVPGARIDAVYMSQRNTPLRAEVVAAPAPGQYDLKVTPYPPGKGKK